MTLLSIPWFHPARAHTQHTSHPASNLAPLFTGETLLLQLLHPGRGHRDQSQAGGEQRRHGRHQGQLRGKAA